MIGPSNEAPLNLPHVERPAESTDDEWLAGARAAAYEKEQAEAERRAAQMQAGQLARVMRRG